MYERMDSRGHEAAEEAPTMVLGDAMNLCQWRKDFHGTISREKTVLQSARAIMGDSSATSKCVNCFRCG